MFKLTFIVSLMFIGTTLWAENLSCDSCGSECVSACGTKHFKSCCFNYLKKRGPDIQYLSPKSMDAELDHSSRRKIEDMLRYLPAERIQKVFNDMFERINLDDFEYLD